MRETFGSNDCGRAGQLLGYLYDESGAAERADFERHLHDCAACRDELAAFTHVRGSVADFRAELLQAAPAVSLGELAASAGATPTAAGGTRASALDETDPRTSPRTESESHAPPRVVPATRGPLAGFASPADGSRASAHSARAALREFFRVSPAWLRASTAAAALALVALSALAVANAEVTFGGERYAIRTGTRPAAAPSAGAPAQPEELTALRTQLNDVTAERDAAVRELEDTRAELDDSRAANLVAAEFETEPDAQQGVSPSPRDERRQRRAPSAPSKSERPLRPARRAAEDEDLPRLLDLLGDAN